MAKGRKSKFIKHVKANEQGALKSLWRTGVATIEQLQKYYGLNGERLKRFENSGFVSIQQDIIRMDEKGIKYCKDELNLEYRYYTTSNHLAHDLKLTEAYCRLAPEIQESWKTEMQLYYEAKQNSNFEGFKRQMESMDPNGRFKAVPDAAILSPQTGEYVAFECITANYNKTDISQKHAFASQFLSGIHKF
jgi:hypothetical protein